MPFRLFDAPSVERSQFVGFSGNVINRDSEHRTDDSTGRALAHPAARLMLMRGGRLYMKFANGSFDAWFSSAEGDSLAANIDEAVLLGTDAGGPVLAVPAGLEPEALPAGVKAIDYRSVYVQGLIDREATGALAQGAALLAWHASHRFCGRCGGRCEMRAGGYKRLCTRCAAEHFPRTDPVAIMLAVSGDDKCLLGRSPRFLPGTISCLAGFIEPGETIENAVRRETFEEAGIRLGRVVYHASQPWPFPYSLMIGCYGEALDETISMDSAELEDCRWFTRGEVGKMLAGTHPENLTVPPEGAIATRLIRDWVEKA